MPLFSSTGEKKNRIPVRYMSSCQLITASSSSLQLAGGHRLLVKSDAKLRSSTRKPSYVGFQQLPACGQGFQMEMLCPAHVSRLFNFVRLKCFGYSLVAD